MRSSTEQKTIYYKKHVHLNLINQNFLLLPAVLNSCLSTCLTLPNNLCTKYPVQWIKPEIQKYARFVSHVYLLYMNKTVIFIDCFYKFTMSKTADLTLLQPPMKSKNFSFDT